MQDKSDFMEPEKPQIKLIMTLQAVAHHFCQVLFRQKSIKFFTSPPFSEWRVYLEIIKTDLPVTT